MKFRSLLLICITLLSACAKNPATGSRDFVMMSETEELKIGKQAFQAFSKQLILLPDNDPLAQYVNRVGQKVAATADRQDLFYHFYVVDDATINAFALPGGYIFIHRGLINHMNNEAELAAVLGHEIGHVTARHSVQQISKARAYQSALMVTSVFVPIPQAATMLTDLIALSVIQGYGRDAEFQSDELSIRYLTQAGYDPKATIGILKTLKRLDEIDTLEKTDAGEKKEKYHGAFSSHPETHKRIEKSIAEAAATQHTRGLTNRDTHLAAVNGYAYGDSAEQGAIVGQKFLHPDLGFQLEFSKDWVINNSPEALQARIKKQEVYFQLQLIELQKRYTVGEVLQKSFPKKRGLQITTGKQAGMDYAHANIKQSAPKVSFAMIDAHVFLQGSRAFVLTMWSHRDEFDKYKADFATVAKSFRAYDKQRDGDIPRISIYQWQAGDSWQKLADRSHNILGSFTAERLAALNGMEKKEKPAKGTLIKVVK